MVKQPSTERFCIYATVYSIACAVSAVLLIIYFVGFVVVLVLLAVSAVLVCRCRCWW